MIKGPSYQLKGRHLPYEFDISVGNGRPLFAAQGISFEVPSTRRLDKEIAATAWLIEDVKLEEPDFPILVGALPPKERFDGDIYEKASALFSELGADVIGEDGISSWAEEQLMSLPSELYPRRRP